jgi:hypothetical protein
VRFLLTRIDVVQSFMMVVRTIRKKMLTLSNGFVVNSGEKVMKTMEKTGLL